MWFHLFKTRLSKGKRNRNPNDSLFENTLKMLKDFGRNNRLRHQKYATSRVRVNMWSKKKQKVWIWVLIEDSS